MALSVKGQKDLAKPIEVMTRVNILGDERDEDGRRQVVPAGTKTKMPRGVAIRLAYGLVRKVEIDPERFDDAVAFAKKQKEIKAQKRKARELSNSNTLILTLLDRIEALEGASKKAPAKKAASA